MLRFVILVLLVVNISFLKGSPIEKKDGIPESKVDRAIASAEIPGAESFSEYPNRPYGLGMPFEHQMGQEGEEQEIMEEEPVIMEPLGEETVITEPEEQIEPLEEQTVVETEEEQ